MPPESRVFAKRRATKAKAEPFPRLFDPARDTPLPDACLQVYADATPARSNVPIEAKQLLRLIMELRWHRANAAALR